MNISEKNADRFLGFVDVYESARPAMPRYPVGIVTKYLGRKPETVVDLGCGTGLSTVIWKGNCVKAVGIEPSDDMLSVAKTKECEGLSFKSGFSHETGLPDGFADAVVCSRSFHWMEPVSTLAEVNRILKKGGVFATVDCDWPPVSDWRADKAYMELFGKVHRIEQTHDGIKDGFIRYSKDKHLENIGNSGYFAFAREIVFSNTEKCTAKRLIDLALSQGSLQSILKKEPALIQAEVDKFTALVNSIFGDTEFEIEFSYRMRIGVK